MSERVMLGVDLGTSSVKAALVSESGSVVSAGTAEYPILRPQAGYAEQDPEAWWRAVCTAVRAATEDADREVTVAAVSFSGQMHGTVLLDDAGELLANAIIWPDQRSSAQVADITQQLGLARLVGIAGSPVATGFQAATLLWIRQELPDVWRRIGTVLLPKDYVRWRMTGELATDPSDASGTVLLDEQRRNWSPLLLDLIGLDERQLPAVQPSAARAGVLCAAAAEDLGLTERVPVVTGAADTACSALGAGAVEAGTLLLTLSTGGQLVQPIDDVRLDVEGRAHTFCSALEPDEGPGWYQMGAILSAGLALRWLRDEVLGVPGLDAYDRMSAWAETSLPGARGLLFLPYLSGKRTPHMDSQARGAFIGLTAEHGQAELTRAVMEGVTLACYDAFAVLSVLGATPQNVILAGGGARSRIWRQMVADVFGLPVWPLAVEEQSAIGAAMLAGAGLDWWNLTDVARAWASYGETVEPDMSRHHRYRALYAIFRQAYAQNVNLFHELGAWARG